MLKIFKTFKKVLTSDFSAHIDHLSPNSVFGWVRRKSGGRPITLDVIVNGSRLVQGLTAQQERPDIAQMTGDAGRYGFGAIFETRIAGDEAVVELIETESGRLIYKKRCQIRHYAGVIERLSGEVLSGWCFRHANPDDLKLDIRCDDKLLASGIPVDQPRPDLSILPFQTSQIGFVASFPSDRRYSDETLISIYDSDTTELISARKIAEIQPVNALPSKVGISRNERESISAAFDPHFYRQRYFPDNPRDCPDPIEHYLTTGWKLGYDPCSWFSTSQYLQNNQDVYEAGQNPFVHYIKWGASEGRGDFANIPGTPCLQTPWICLGGDVALTKCNLVDQVLHLEGFARHPEYRGMPVRLDLSVAGRSPERVLANVRLKPLEREIIALGQGFYKFNAALAIQAMDGCLTLQLSIVDTALHESIELAPQIAETGDIVYPDPDPAWTVIGRVEGISTMAITGWAVYRESPNTPITLQMMVNGRPVNSVMCRFLRKDIRRIHGGDGFAGFAFEVPPEASLTDLPITFEIGPVIGKNLLKGLMQLEFPTPNGLFFPSLLPLQPQIHETPSHRVSDRPISAVVLNRNGAEVLNKLLVSAHQYEEPDLIEWIIVDHASTDNSEKIAATAAERGQNVRFVCRDGNFSFSESNNFGAGLASHDVLAFINNDLIFRAPFRVALLQGLADQDVGAYGVMLLDHFPDEAAASELPIQHVGVCIRPKIEGKWIRPFELRPLTHMQANVGAVTEMPMVTGAFLAVSRADFNAIGGFSTDYIYGLEDVDLCLKIRHDLGKKVICDNTADIIHHRGYSRNTEKDVGLRHRNNNTVFNRAWGTMLRQEIRQSVMRRPGFWTGALPVVAFIVADAKDNTSAGEYYTALEMGHSLQKLFPCHLRFITRADWDDISGVDILIVMVASFNIETVREINPFIILINWTRQWFDRWADSGTLTSYDMVFASSARAAAYLEDKSGVMVDVLPIATNYSKFSSGTPREEFKSDYCFTGNYVGTRREIMYQLKPDVIAASGAVYGFGWAGLAFDDICRGPVAYPDLPDLYASTKIVIDDANIATKPWGSCNSRIFDAVAAGCLIVTNGPHGVREIFGDLVPVFDSPESLRDIIEYWSSHDNERRARVAQLQRIVREGHVYDIRARAVAHKLLKGDVKPRLAIKCAAKFRERLQWGDYHFAEALAKELRKQGITVRIDCRERWNSALSEADDAVLVLRGLIRYDLKPHQINLMWLISHPEDVSHAEMNQYDHVFVASHLHAEALQNVTTVDVEPLLQCTDASRFNLDATDEKERSCGNPIFVGNSRGVFRNSVRWSIELGEEVDIYGRGWASFVQDRRFKGEHLMNELLPAFYGRARIVLCDHWDDMKRYGYLSNRAFDILACGSWLAVDDVSGIENILPGGYCVFHTMDELGDILRRDIFGSPEERRDLANWVLANHTYLQRSRVIAERLRVLWRGERPANSAQEGRQA